MYGICPRYAEELPKRPPPTHTFTLMHALPASQPLRCPGYIPSLTAAAPLSNLPGHQALLYIS